MMTRPYYFGAGPAAIPTEVLTSIQEELLDWQGTGISMLEIGHRTTVFEQLMASLEALFREAACIPSHYRVLFIGAPTRAHFAWIPQNFLRADETAGYWITGQWSQAAYAEAKKVKRAYCIASTEATQFRSIPSADTWHFEEKSAYCYVAPNETIHGVRFFPDITALSTPVIADMTSCLLTEPIDISAYGMIIAGVQKNLANAGLSVVIVSDAMLESIQDKHLATLSDYRTYAQSGSLYATPPTFNCYVMLKVLTWLQAQGGVHVFYEKNLAKAQALYDYIDKSDFYRSPVAPEARSMVNIPFTCVNSKLEATFLTEAAKRGLLGLAGHRVVGGMRASIYNALPYEGIAALIDFMEAFAKKS